MSTLTLTLEQLKALKPCKEGYSWYSKNIDTTDLNIILHKLANQKWVWCKWLFVKLLRENQNRALAIYCAELTLPTFEATYPDDKRPREAIEAASAYLKGEISEDALQVKRRDASAAYAAAAYAAYASAAYAAAASAAYAAAASAAAASAANYTASVAYATTNAEETKTLIVNKVLDLLSTQEGELTNEQ